MASSSIVQFRRRSAGQLRALEWVERQVRGSDPSPKRKYLREFQQAFAAYERPATSHELEAELRQADIILIGDYHALPASQLYAAEVLEELRRLGRKIVLGLEAIFARDQSLLDAWQRHEISDEQLRQRLRFERNWGFEWDPVCALLLAARSNGVPVNGLDCPPRSDFRAIGVRDRHAASKIAELRARHPEAAIVVLFGESHLAPQHLPAALKVGRSGDDVLTLVQNVDSLYWKAAAEGVSGSPLRVRENVYCVFSATPLEKHESYRFCLERWQRMRTSALDLEPTFYNLLDSLLDFLGIDKYSTNRPRFLVDEYPEIAHCGSPGVAFELLSHANVVGTEGLEQVRKLEERGSLYLPALNTIAVRRIRLSEAAEELAFFVHHACTGVLSPPALDADDFYYRTMLKALAYIGSRALNPGRKPEREQDLYGFYTLQSEEVEARFLFSHREFLRIIDALVLHKDFEVNVQRYLRPPALVAELLNLRGRARSFAIESLGNILGSDIFESYVRGGISKRALRSLFFKSLAKPGIARQLYFEMARRTASPSQRLAA